MSPYEYGNEVFDSTKFGEFLH